MLLTIGPSCSFLLDDDANPSGGSDAGEPDGVAPDVPSAVDGPADASMNTDDFRFPYICDDDTIALYHFDMPATLADECNGNGFPAGTGIRSERGPPGFMSAAAPQGGNVPTAALVADSERYTVDAWILADAQAGRVLRLGDAAFASDTLRIDVVGNGGQVELQVDAPSVGAGLGVPTQLDTWTHLRVVWDGSVLTVYRDGDCVGTSLPGIILGVPLESLRIIENQMHMVDEVRVSSSARLIVGEVCPVSGLAGG